MRNWIAVLTVAAVLGSVAYKFSDAAPDEKKPKHTTKIIMTKGMKGGLCKKVASGSATAEERLLLLDYFISLAESKPPKGDAASWKAKTNALIIGAAKAVTERDDAGKVLGAAANCKACHTAHKG